MNSKVVFLVFCHVLIAHVCHSGRSSHSRSDSVSGSRQKGKWRLMNRVKKLQDKTAGISKTMMEKKKINQKLTDDLEALQAILEATDARVEELRNGVNGNTACCAKITAQVLATSPPTTTISTVQPTTTEVLSTSPPTTTTSTVKPTTTEVLTTSTPTTTTSTVKPTTTEASPPTTTTSTVKPTTTEALTTSPPTTTTSTENPITPEGMAASPPTTTASTVKPTTPEGPTTLVTQTASTDCGMIRLVNGSGPWEGRVEVFHDGEWGTVCDDGWDTKEARIVCSMLGFQGGNVAELLYGPGKGPILMDVVECTGEERSLYECPFRGWGVHSCHHKEDAAVKCIMADTSSATSPPTITASTVNPTSLAGPTTPNASTAGEMIRLVDGPGPWEGRIEVFHDGEWGTVCEDEWEDVEARIVCSMLGFKGGWASSAPDWDFGPGTGPILMTDVRCTGEESSLFECPFPGWGDHSCDHTQDAGVECTMPALVTSTTTTSTVHPTTPERSTTTVTPTTSPPCGMIRLVDGAGPWEGRVEVFHDGEWGTVCESEWDREDARVVCSTLGFKGGYIPSDLYYGAGNGTILMDDTRCTGEESSFFDCPFRGWGYHSCYHTEDAGVECIMPVTSSATSQPTTTTSTVNPTTTEALASPPPTTTTSTVKPTTTEALPTSPPTTITSTVNPTTPEGLIRLVNGSGAWMGRLEVYHEGEWGTVCDDYWDSREAMIVCSMLGFQGGYETIGRPFGPGNGTILMDDLDCTGNESSLFECPFRGWGDNNCGHHEDIGVECLMPGTSPTDGGMIRLVNGSGAWEGRVEVFHDGEWGTVCNDDWDNVNAKIVCSMLGFTGGNITYVQKYGSGNGTIFMDDVWCSGEETSLFECPFRGWGVNNCNHLEDAGVECIMPETSTATNTTPLPW